MLPELAKFLQSSLSSFNQCHVGIFAELDPKFSLKFSALGPLGQRKSYDWSEHRLFAFAGLTFFLVQYPLSAHRSR